MCAKRSSKRCSPLDLPTILDTFRKIQQKNDRICPIKSERNAQSHRARSDTQLSSESTIQHSLSLLSLSHSFSLASSLSLRLSLSIHSSCRDSFSMSRIEPYHWYQGVPVLPFLPSRPLKVPKSFAHTNDQHRNETFILFGGWFGFAEESQGKIISKKTDHSNG